MTYFEKHKWNESNTNLWSSVSPYFNSLKIEITKHSLLKGDACMQLCKPQFTMRQALIYNQRVTMQLAVGDNNQCCNWYTRGDLCLGLIKWGVVKHKHGIVGLDQSLGLCLRETCP